MSGLDMLGALPYIGADAVVSRLNAASRRVSNAAKKLQRLHPKAARALATLATTAARKGTVLAKVSVAKPKAVTKTAVKLPTAKTAVTSAAAPATRTAAAVTTASAAASPATRSAPSAIRSATPAIRSAAAPAPVALAINRLRLAGARVGDVELTAQTLMARQQLAKWADLVDDAGVAGEAIALIQPLLGQLQTIGGTKQLVIDGSALIAKANTMITTAAQQTPPDQLVST